MTLDFLAYWTMMALSLFNTMVLFWLGFTVWLNAEKKDGRFRQGGIWLATAGLLLGGIFFATHTAMLDFTVDALVRGVRSWWYFFFAPIILLPFAWYLLMLWYAGFWDDKNSALHQRHVIGLCTTIVLVLALIALLFFTNPFAVAARSTTGIVRTSGRLFPYVALLYPIYILICTALSLDALHRPAKSGRMMGDLARRRARPWLLAATLVQLVVSLLVCGAFAWLILALRNWPVGRILNDGGDWIDQLDLLLTLLLAITIVLVGKAMVSYEIFTGKTLPRRGFLRQWRGVVTIAGVSSVLIAWCIGVDLRPIYALLLVVILATATFALLSWRFFREREEMMQQLRPFAASQHLYERVLGASRQTLPNIQQETNRPQESNAPPESNAPQEYFSSDSPSQRSEALATFSALCSVLETTGARLVPLGTLAPLVGAPLCFPDDEQAPPMDDQLAAYDFSPQQMAVAIESFGDLQRRASWAIPLWSQRGQIGVLVLGRKRRGALYSEEEIALAQSGSERLLDALAGAALASRLMELQRRRLSEAQLVGGQSTLRLRRALHDEILPRLHAAMLMMNGDATARIDAQNQLADAHREISSLLRAMPSALPSSLVQHGLFGALRRAVEDEFSGQFDEVVWNISPAAEALSAELSGLVCETIFHAAREAVRNASRYARGEGQNLTAPLRLSISAFLPHAESNFQSDIQSNFQSNFQNEGLEITIEDNGVGASREYSSIGSGQGLALHSTMMAVAGGALSVEAAQPCGTRVRLSLAL